ncbi:signal recognition particle-docking protein FtsY [endosymbiont 'TC1' of Trimyema compressum]|uniref:signal recognition particle-docking protein FtsY n=1 Tax=endosymbiont 'TC1' of Trimyema compressum TaxID=243899 RepID=UPI0007F0B59E|nr:signal recognition particle-docking protein FtsY [endosymbiont 'TC1' of Trimyema compressum]AMP20704.1 signal recognition particle-docking protein FtsY [endosymbiont 'TC1' of Trimyema compressum]
MFKKWIKGFKKTKDNLQEKLTALITGYKGLEDDFYDDLEEILITSDMGVATSMNLIEKLKVTVKAKRLETPAEALAQLKEEMTAILEKNDGALKYNSDSLTIWVVVGVNGVGKTTSIGKLAHEQKANGKKVFLAAADTFRAGAIDQLKVWGERVGVPVIAHQEGGDPGAVVFDSIESAKAKGADLLIIDTAGRLHNKDNLMEEMKKIGRIIEKVNGGPADEILLVLDGGTGQNAIAQGEAFNEALSGLTGLIITKLDGTAKGGVIIPLINQLSIPVKLVGIGEGIDDLEQFSASDFLEGLLGEED